MNKPNLICWTQEEWSKVIAYGVQHYDRSYKGAVSASFLVAQRNALGAHRVRPFDPETQSRWNKAVHASLLKLRTPQTPPTPPPSGTLADNLLKDPLEALILQALAKPTVRDAILAIVTANFAVSVPLAAASQPTNVITLRHKDKLPTVLVGGLKGHQITEISNTFKGKLDVVFWSSDRSLQELKQKAPHCEHAFGFINFISHAADAIMKARSPHYHQVSGGLDTLKKQMAKLVRKIDDSPIGSLSQTLQTYPYA